MRGYTGHPYKWVPNKSTHQYQKHHKYKYVKKVDIATSVKQESNKLRFEYLASGKVSNPPLTPPKLTYQRREATIQKPSRFKYVREELIKKGVKAATVVTNKVTLRSPPRQLTAYKYVRSGVSTRMPQASEVRKLLTKEPMRRCISTRFKYSRVPIVRQTRVPPFRRTSGTRWERISGGGSIKLVSRYAIRRLKPVTNSQPLPSAHHYRRLVQKAVTCLRYRRGPICMIFVKTGRCDAGNKCRFVHDKNYLRICPRFLSQRCPLGSASCPLAHVLDPCRIPVCEFHEGTGCTRSHCPYLHVSYPPNTPLCPDFLRGRCRRGRLCDKRHSWRTKTSTWHKPIKKVSKAAANLKQPSSGTTRGAVSFRDAVKQIVATLTPSDIPDVAPQGSLRHAYPAPIFIPLLKDDDLDQEQVSQDVSGSSTTSQDPSTGPTRIR